MSLSPFTASHSRKKVRKQTMTTPENTSPMRSTRALGLIAIIILICVLLIGYVDKPTLLFVKQHVTGDLKAFFRVVTDFGRADAYVLGALLLFIVGRVTSRRTTPHPAAEFYGALSRSGLFVLVSLACSAVIVHAMKLSFGRPRPKLLFTEDFYGFHFLAFDTKFNSFPSGHSQTIWAVMIPLALLFPKGRYVFIAAATFIASSRVLVTAHFPSDVVMGSFIAIMCALAVHRRWFSDLEFLPFPSKAPETKSDSETSDD